MQPIAFRLQLPPSLPGLFTLERQTGEIYLGHSNDLRATHTTLVDRAANDRSPVPSIPTLNSQGWIFVVRKLSDRETVKDDYERVFEKMRQTHGDRLLNMISNDNGDPRQKGRPTNQQIVSDGFLITKKEAACRIGVQYVTFMHRLRKLRDEGVIDRSSTLDLANLRQHFRTARETSPQSPQSPPMSDQEPKMPEA